MEPIQNHIYDPPTTFAIFFDNQTFATATKLTKTIKPIIHLLSGMAPSLKLIKYSDGRFTVSSEDASDEGSYELGIRVGYEEFPSVAVECKVGLTVSYEPKFIGDEIKD